MFPETSLSFTLLVRCPSNNAITYPINYIEISWLEALDKKPVDRVRLCAADTSR